MTAGFAPRMYAGGSNTIQLALIGCGGRGSGAAADALNAKGGPVKLVAMADAFENRLAGSYQNLKNARADQVDVPEERRFVGFDGYKKAMDCLRPGDIAIFGTPPAFRWVHFQYAIGKNLNVFMEKPITVDGPTSRRMLKTADEATAKNLKVGVGLMSRHAGPPGTGQTRPDGQIANHPASAAPHARPDRVLLLVAQAGGVSEVAYQVQRFHTSTGPASQLQRLQHPQQRPPRLSHGRRPSRPRPWAAAL